METEIQLSLADATGIAMEHAKAGRNVEALATYEAILVAHPDDTNALTNAGILMCQVGRLPDGIAALERAHALLPGNEAVRANLATAYRLTCQSWASGHSRDFMIGCVRKLMALEPDNEPFRANLETLLAYNELPAMFSDYEPGRDPATAGKTILIACMPKSGSSWLVNAVRNLSGFMQAQFANACIENEQELYLPAVRYWFKHDVVVQQHCRASAPNLHLVQAYGMKPVVLVRDLFDTLVSMRDFWDAGAVRNSFLYPDWNALDKDAKHDALVRHLAPWYVQFFVSWAMAERKGDVAPLWVRYEDMIPNKPETLFRVAEFCGLGADEAKIARTIAAVDGDKASTRFNKGVAGRGQAAFTDEQKDTVRALTRAFPSVDFSPIGL